MSLQQDQAKGEPKINQGQRGTAANTEVQASRDVPSLTRACPRASCPRRTAAYADPLLAIDRHALKRLGGWARRYSRQASSSSLRWPASRACAEQRLPTRRARKERRRRPRDERCETALLGAVGGFLTWRDLQCFCEGGDRLAGSGFASGVCACRGGLRERSLFSCLFLPCTSDLLKGGRRYSANRKTLNE